MALDLIGALGRDFSPRVRASYLEERRPSLPWRILRSGVSGSDRRVRRVASALRASRESAAASRNPELYPHLVRMAAHGYDDRAAAHILLQSHLRDVDASMRKLGVKPTEYVRLIGPEPRVYRGGILVANAAVRTASGIVLFLPLPGLFADLVPKRLSPRRRPLTIPAPEMVDDAITIISRYAPSLAVDLVRAITVIGFTTPLGDPHQWSYNLRLSYLGGVFIDPHPRSISRLVEGLIHEYAHQRLWEWWGYEPLTGVDEKATIRSPLTGRDRTVAVMLHAFLIYAQLLDFYRVAIERGFLPPEDGTWPSDREAQLKQTVPRLYALLQEHTIPRSTARQFIDFIADRAGGGCPS